MRRRLGGEETISSAYSFHVVQRGPVDIQLTGAMQAHPYIFLTDTKGAIIALKDGYPTLSASLNAELEPGTYHLVATTNGGSEDDYTLTVKGPVAELIVGRRIQDTDFLVVGHVKDPGGNPIQDVDVSVENDNATQCGGIHKTRTNGDGAFALSVDSNSLPSQSVMSISGNAVLDRSVNLSITPDNIGVRFGNIEAESQSPYQVEIDSPPELVHLGDNNFGGSINSKFQKSSQGLTKSYVFELNSNLFVQPVAEISLFGKGFESNNELTINNQFVGYLNTAPPDGSFERITLRFPSSFLKNGRNVISVESVLTGKPNNDHDDFEFQNIILNLSP